MEKKGELAYNITDGLTSDEIMKLRSTLVVKNKVGKYKIRENILDILNSLPDYKDQDNSELKEYAGKEVFCIFAYNDWWILDNSNIPIPKECFY